MPGTILVSEALWRVSVLLNDTAPQFNRWSEAELVDWLNDGHLAICKYLPVACTYVDTIRLKPGTRQSVQFIAAADRIPGDGSEATDVRGTQVLDVVRNMGAAGNAPGEAIRLIANGRKVLDATDRNWHNNAGKVRQWMTDPRKPDQFYVSKAVPGSPALWVEVMYAAQPKRIPNGALAAVDAIYAKGSSNTEVIQVQDIYLDDLVNYGAARAFMKNMQAGDSAKAAGYANLFLGSLNSQVAATTGNNPNLKRLPLAPAPVASAS